MKLYNEVDNIRRKARNTNDQVEAGQNRNVKAYSTKPGQLSARAQADVQAKQYAKLNKKQPVKTLADMSPEEIEKIKAKYAA